MISSHKIRECAILGLIEKAFNFSIKYENPSNKSGISTQEPWMFFLESYHRPEISISFFVLDLF